MKLNLSLGLLATLQLLFGFLFQFVIFTLVGVGLSTDAWVAAQAVPTIFFAIFAGVIQGEWQGRLATVGKVRVDWLKMLSTAYGQLLLMCVPIFIILASTERFWIEKIFTSFNLHQINLVTQLSAPLLGASLFNVFSTLGTVALRGSERFIACEAILLGTSIGSLVIIIILIPIYGIYAAAWVMLCRSLISSVALFVIAGRPWPLIRLSINDRPGWRTSRTLVAGGLIYKSGPLVDRIFSSMTDVGGMTVFNLAQMAVSAAGVAFERALTIPIQPEIARAVKDRDWEFVVSSVRKNLLYGLIVPVGAAASVILMYPYWEAISQHFFNLSSDQALEFWKICLVFSVLLYPLSVGFTVVSALYSIGESKIVTYIGVSGFVLSLGMKSILFDLGGLIGLAAGICVHYLLNLLVMTIILRSKIRSAVLSI